MPNILPSSFFAGDDVTRITRSLLGKVLCTQINGTLTSGIIVEAEAYNGRIDRACHAYPNIRTPRTSIIYGKPGMAYVYLCYGIHHLFNIVTNREGLADAILIRAVEPLEGIEEMLIRRKKNTLHPSLTNGPGKLSQALGITTRHYGANLAGPTIWLEDRGYRYPKESIVAAPRIGVDYAGEDALLPWRYYVSESKWLSK